MPGFLAAAPAIISAGSALAGAFGKRKKLAPIDVTPLAQTIKAGAARQRQGVLRLRPSLQPLTSQLKTGTEQAVQEAGEAGRTSSAKFLEDIGQLYSPEATRNTANLYSQRVLEQQPTIEQARRESLAATGGLNRGAASRSATQAASDLATTLSRGQQDIALQGEQDRQQALAAAKEKAFNLDQNFIQQKLGIDRDTLGTIFSTGREDLIREALDLLNINTNETQQMLDLQKFGINQNYAGSVAGAQGHNELLNTLLQGGLQGLSTIYGKKAG